MAEIKDLIKYGLWGEPRKDEYSVLKEAEAIAAEAWHGDIIKQAEDVAVKAWDESDPAIPGSLPLKGKIVDVFDKDFEQAITTLKSVYATEIDLDTIANGLREGHGYMVTEFDQRLNQLPGLSNGLAGELYTSPNGAMAFRIKEDKYLEDVNLLEPRSTLNMSLQQAGGEDALVILKRSHTGRVIDLLAIRRIRPFPGNVIPGPWYTEEELKKGQ